MSKLDAKQRNDLDEKKFAFPQQRKEPLENATHALVVSQRREPSGIDGGARHMAIKIGGAVLPPDRSAFAERALRHIDRGMRLVFRLAVTSALRDTVVRAATADLFDAPAVPGPDYRHNFVSEAEESVIISRIAGGA